MTAVNAASSTTDLHEVTLQVRIGLSERMANKTIRRAVVVQV